MMKRLTQGNWTLRDMREQFQAVLKMGPLSNIMNQFPGMGGLDFHESGARIKKWLTMMDSMTERRAALHARKPTPTPAHTLPARLRVGRRAGRHKRPHPVARAPHRPRIGAATPQPPLLAVAPRPRGRDALRVGTTRSRWSSCSTSSS